MLLPKIWNENYCQKIEWLDHMFCHVFAAIVPFALQMNGAICVEKILESDSRKEDKRAQRAW